MVWTELWQELYHQGDVGLASYAVVPHLCRIESARPLPDWQAYALVVSIDLARDGPRENPAIPTWLESAYSEALDLLVLTGTRQLNRATDPTTARSILAVLALGAGLRRHARVLLELDESEVEALERAAFG